MSETQEQPQGLPFNDRDLVHQLRQGVRLGITPDRIAELVGIPLLELLARAATAEVDLTNAENEQAQRLLREASDQPPAAGEEEG